MDWRSGILGEELNTQVVTTAHLRRVPGLLHEQWIEHIL